MLHKVSPKAYDSSYYVIDIRSKQAYLNEHVQGSINLQTFEEVRDFINQQVGQVTPPP
ncbi:rhodanese-like domain-containing protein, partial [Helicobacter cetorum]|uniref:rhodanese-like domain-containing protein n=1 Tax=Helicobacter cetorum TaxID=138563 RepID=UPI003AEFF2F1